MMSGESKHPAIKLFGKAIPLIESQHRDCPRSPNQSKDIDLYPDKGKGHRHKSLEADNNSGYEDYDKESLKGNQCARTPREELDNLSNASTESSTMVPENGENPAMHQLDKENSAPNKINSKKPDKKTLSCPRCNSMEIKFCYYNNYNTNQPRHFCKNCQRYWTAGGTMRNVPVGAGKRKSKTSSCSPASSNRNHSHQSASAEDLSGDRANIAGLYHCTALLRPDGTGNVCVPDSTCGPLFPHTPALWPSVPMYPVPTLATPVAYWGCSFPTNWTVFPCMSRQPYPSSGQNPVEPSADDLNTRHSVISCSRGTLLPQSATEIQPYVSTPTTSKKRSREETVLEHNDREEGDEMNGSDRFVPIPKTLRIDDQGEAERSSIRATLGFNKSYNKAESFTCGSLFNAFEPKFGGKSCTTEASPAMQANPAALSRSLNFHEGS